MEKISIQTLNSLFTFLNSEVERILWIRDKTYTKQIYLNDTFENIWLHPVDLLYDHPNKFNDLLLPDDKPSLISEFNHRMQNNEHDGVILMRALDAKGNIMYLKDRSYMLLDAQGQHIGYLGIGQRMKEQEWQAELAMRTVQLTSAEEKLRRQVFQVLKKELNLETANKIAEISAKPLTNAQQITLRYQGKAVPLTEREQQCLYHLVAGRSAKQTAALMHISVRTVEFHLNNIKQKSDCRTKLQLISKIATE